MTTPCTNPVPKPCLPAVTDPRVIDSFTRRFNAATRQALVAVPPHTTNGDEARYADKCGTYTKAVRQESPGKVDLAAYALFTKALASGSFADFEKVVLGGTRTLNGPMGAYAYTYLGTDAGQFGDAPSPSSQETAVVVPPAPALASEAYAAELIELYWASLLRDVAFTDYAANATANAAASELSGLAAYAGPRVGGKVTPAVLFRGSFAGETDGPYLSQLFLTPASLGALPITQRYATYVPNVDYMTDLTTWAQVQNGISTGLSNQTDPVLRYLHDGRGLASYTHVDELFQAYLVAYLVLHTTGAALNPRNPYVSSKVQNGFGTFGYPDFASVLAQVAKIALNTVWHQKWPIHLRHRPESGGGLVQLIDQGMHFDGSPSQTVFKSEAVRQSSAKYKSSFLSQAFPEGSPAHPAYPTGHGTVGGACITILKFFFDGAQTIANPQVPSADGTTLTRWTGAPLTLAGELNKLARNVSFGHGVHAGIHWRSDTDVSMLLGEAVALGFLTDLACTYAEPFTIQITKLDGTTATISNQ